MSLALRLLVVPAVVGLLFAGVTLSNASNAGASTPRVVIHDNDGPTPAQGIDVRTGEWGFSPHHTTVLKGEPVVFDHPAGNARPHNIVSISNAGSATAPALEAGARFSSGTSQDTWLRAGGSWTLDTGGLDAGHYSYFCSLHPWMVGSLTVLAP